MSQGKGRDVRSQEDPLCTDHSGGATVLEDKLGHVLLKGEGARFSPPRCIISRDPPAGRDSGRHRSEWDLVVLWLRAGDRREVGGGCAVAPRSCEELHVPDDAVR